MKTADSLVLARGEMKKALTALNALERLLEDALADIDKAETERKKERKLFRRKK